MNGVGREGGGGVPVGIIREYIKQLNSILITTNASLSKLLWRKLATGYKIELFVTRFIFPNLQSLYRCPSEPSPFLFSFPPTPLFQQKNFYISKQDCSTDCP